MNITSRISNLENILIPKDKPHVVIHDDYKFDINTFALADKTYIPTPTGKKFHESNDFVKLVMGPFGSGKSTMACADIVLRSIEMPPCTDGVRRSRWAIIRNTAGDLESTTLQTWLEWFGDLGEIDSRKKPILNYVHFFNSTNGPVEIQLLFLGMDLEKDVRKFKSLNLTGIYINELSEISSIVLEHGKGRCGRYPSRNMLDEEHLASKAYQKKLNAWKEALRMTDEPDEMKDVWFWRGVIADTNPPDVDSYIYDMFEKNTPLSHIILKQPPGLLQAEDGSLLPNDNAENITNIGGPSYYFTMAEGATQEFINVMVLGKYGTVMDGKLVHTNYNDDIHAVDDIELDVNEPVFLGWDYGLTPACLVSQYVGGQRRDILEFTSDRMFIREFADVVVKPWIVNNLMNMDVYSTADKSGGKEDPLHSTYILNEVLADIGIETEPSSTNNIQPRLDAVDHFLCRLIEGKPLYILSKKGCPKLRKGFLKYYTYTRVAVVSKDPVYRDEPTKSHPWSDIQDCGQYNSLRMLGDYEKFNSAFEEDHHDYWYPEGRSKVTGY